MQLDGMAFTQQEKVRKVVDMTTLCLTRCISRLDIASYVSIHLRLLQVRWHREEWVVGRGCSDMWYTDNNYVIP